MEPVKKKRRTPQTKITLEPEWQARVKIAVARGTMRDEATLISILFKEALRNYEENNYKLITFGTMQVSIPPRLKDDLGDSAPPPGGTKVRK